MNLKGRKQSQLNLRYHPSMYGETEKKFKNLKVSFKVWHPRCVLIQCIKSG